ncbi:hypothetical protein QAD02_001296 [Eretmocerus hayati]|uniref:Uncharacterized protein n=1 Tax=Eretmocerus hayati TaxID=131215 RepID=A0ACC2NFV5_9HYME|nr:hypothetical protein QAD02_001296 [Eretmocerus hayati]
MHRDDECKKGLSPEGKFEDYRSIYSQSMRPYKRKDFEWYGENATMALLGLAKYSKIFGRSYNFTEIKKLIKKDDAMFAGALIFKFGMVIYSRLTNIKLNSPSGSLSDFKDTSITENSQVSSSLKSLGFLNIFGCAPNARNCPTNGNKHMMYALHPIEKGTPLITSMCSIYSFVPKSQRQAIYKDFYHRPCECQACQENWLDGQTDMDRNLVNYALQKISQPTIVNKIEREFEEIRKIMDERYYEPNHPDIKLLLRTRDLVKTSWKYFPMPSMSTHKAIRLLTACQESFFSPMTWDPEMTSSCSK